jgi:hypothetical protein
MKWEYLVELLPYKGILQQEVLNSLGREGWELVTIVAFEGERTAYLKRPINVLTQVNESRQAYESGEVRRGSATDLIEELTVDDKLPMFPTLAEFENRVLQMIKKNL